MRSLVVAPHPDDEVLGAGGTLLRRKAEGGSLAWLIVTSVSAEFGWSHEEVSRRRDEITQIKKIFGFEKVYELGFPTTQLDRVPVNKLVSAVSNAISDFSPDEIFVPHPADIHSDHRTTFDVVASCTKWFRSGSVKRILAYETLSETEFGLDPIKRFQPNFFVNIENYLEDKISAMNVYASEVREFPFPRSDEALSALATLRGANSGFKAAEAFELLREIC